ncbi:MAG: polysaccharide deacetylase family protein [Marinilabiliaceae bacterium]|nr:polysaccharide deacetylase family protein [Marinilabiliaceae bacterium]
MRNRIKYVLPFYHSVSDSPLPHIKNLYNVKTAKVFEKEVDYFLKRYYPVSLEEFYNYSINQFSSIEKPIVHFTFDDGLSECYLNIAPILLRKGVPATFFLNTGFIDNADLFFRFKISLIIEKLKISSKSKVIVQKIINAPDEETSIKQLYNLKYSEQQTIENIAQAIGLDFDQYLTDKKPYMNKMQIVDLSKKGFDFGTHSIDHPEFQYISMHTQIEQVKNSITALEQIIPTKIKSFSFPFTDFGVSKEVFDELFSKQIFDISFGTAGIKKDSAAMNFQRIPMENYNSIRQSLLMQKSKYYLRNMIGIGKIKRE